MNTFTTDSPVQAPAGPAEKSHAGNADTFSIRLNYLATDLEWLVKHCHNPELAARSKYRGMAALQYVAENALARVKELDREYHAGDTEHATETEIRTVLANLIASAQPFANLFCLAVDFGARALFRPDSTRYFERHGVTITLGDLRRLHHCLHVAMCDHDFSHDIDVVRASLGALTEAALPFANLQDDELAPRGEAVDYDEVLIHGRDFSRNESVTITVGTIQRLRSAVDCAQYLIGSSPIA